MYDLWNNHGKCPPTLMSTTDWYLGFQLESASFTTDGRMQIRFRARPGTAYTIEYTEALGPAANWKRFLANGTKVATSTSMTMEDDFTANTSGGPSPTGRRFYRFVYTN
jgi:hypothetical protein